MDIREAVRKALESQGAGPAVLSNRERFLSYVSDYMGEDESPEFNVLVNNYRSGVIEIFAKALEEGTSDALETAYLRGVDLPSRPTFDIRWRPVSATPLALRRPQLHNHPRPTSRSLATSLSIRRQTTRQTVPPAFRA